MKIISTMVADCSPAAQQKSELIERHKKKIKTDPPYHINEILLSIFDHFEKIGSVNEMELDYE